MNPKVSVVLTVKNVEKYISNCLKSILNQTFSNFEIIIIDDVSSDKTRVIIEKFKDTRIKYIRNSKWIGLSRSRNKCLEQATGDYLFFTDGDCTVSTNWIEEGLRYLNSPDCIGVEGKTYYVSEECKPTRSDDVVENKKGGLFMTCNIAYKKVVLESIGGFDERFTFHEDRDLALRALKYGKIPFSHQMIAFHQKKTFNPKQFVKNGKILRNSVLLYKKFRDKPYLVGRMANPKDLMTIMFPILVFASLFRNVYKTKDDFNLFPYIYVRLIYERLEFWDMCVRERVFLI